MKNITITEKDGIVTITIDTSKSFGPSSSGKTTVIASTCGNVPVPNHPAIKIGVNCYR